MHYVLVGNAVVECHPRGKFRLKDQKVLAGDRVEVTLTGDGTGRIDRVLPRVTRLQRPPVANVDQAVLVCTLREPPADLRFLDRVLVHAGQAGVHMRIALNKVELLTADEAAAFASTYAAVGYAVDRVSAATGDGLDRLREALAGHTSVLAGQSGVGKSRLTRALAPGHRAAVGHLSPRLGHGRHTTRHVELIPLPGGGLIADAPGFTHQVFSGLEPRELGDLFIDFTRPAANCRFDDCLHRAEPDCGVKAAVAAGAIQPFRYEHYLEFLAEIEAARKW